MVHRVEVMHRVMQLGESRRQIVQAANVEMNGSLRPAGQSLGVDAAWTVTEPSGMGLLHESTGGRWQCAALTPSDVIVGRGA